MRHKDQNPETRSMLGRRGRDRKSKSKAGGFELDSGYEGGNRTT